MMLRGLTDLASQMSWLPTTHTRCVSRQAYWRGEVCRRVRLL